MNLISSLIAVAIITVGFGCLFLVAGIVGSFMIEGLVHNESIRFFTYIGLGIGWILGCVAVRAYERKKHGQG